MFLITSISVLLITIIIYSITIKDDIEEKKFNRLERRKRKYKNDDEIKKPVFPKRSDMQPPPSPEKIDYPDLDLYNSISIALNYKELNEELKKNNNN